jgi:hypothetical protein
VRLPLNEETAWERAQHEKFRAHWGGNPFKGCLFFGTLSGSAVNRT